MCHFVTAKLCRKELDECFPGFDDSILVFPVRTRIQGLNFWVSMFCRLLIRRIWCFLPGLGFRV
jgi:hypothetical protein